MLFFSTLSALGQALGAILNPLCALLGQHAARLPARTELLCLIHWRLARVIGRFDRLVLRWQAGTLPKPRLRRRAPSANAAKPPVRIPGGNLWLIRSLQPTAQFSGQVTAFLANPETRALVQAAPQAGRILRPLCRGLGIAPPDWLRLPQTPRPTRAPRRRPSPAPAAPPRPLPAYVRAAVRHWRKNHP